MTPFRGFSPTSSSADTVVWLACQADGGRDAVGLLLVDAVAEPRLSRVLLDHLQDRALASLVGQAETKNNNDKRVVIKNV